MDSLRSLSLIRPLKFYTKPCCIGFPSAMYCLSMMSYSHHFWIAFEVSSVTLSDTIIPGLPRRSVSESISSATRLLEIEVSGIGARQSRVTSSITLSTWRRGA